MRFGIGVALFLSILMVLGAGYFRVQGPKPLAAVVSVSNPIDSLPASTTEGYIATSTPEEKPESLTTTDLVARQLLLDYLGLASAGQTDDNSLQSLANKYVDQIASLSTTTKVFDASNLLIVPDNSSNYAAYDKALTILSQNFENTLSGIDISKLTDAAHTFASAYSNQVSKMKSMPVPTSVASTHARIIADYQTLASAYNTMTLTNIDPADGFANLSKIKDMNDQSDTLLLELSNIIKTHE